MNVFWIGLVGGQARSLWGSSRQEDILHVFSKKIKASTVVIEGHRK